MNKEELINLFWDNYSDIDWERYDFVDPPYVWNVMGSLEVDGYIFDIDGDEIVNDGYEVRTVNVTTPNGEEINLINR